MVMSIEDLAAAYELRHGYDEPTPWKRIANAFGVSCGALAAAIKRIEQKGVARDANGKKPLSRPTKISDADLELIEVWRRAGNTWAQIAGAISLPVGTVQCRYWRWKRR